MHYINFHSLNKYLFILYLFYSLLYQTDFIFFLSFPLKLSFRKCSINSFRKLRDFWEKCTLFKFINHLSFFNFQFIIFSNIKCAYFSNLFSFLYDNRSNILFIRLESLFFFYFFNVATNFSLHFK